jgi:uncharacterized protein YjbJ (UPF0337 family)
MGPLVSTVTQSNVLILPSLSLERKTKGSSGMDREHIKGTAEKAKGAIKDTAGKVTGDKKLQTEGKLDKAKGSAHNVSG